jgi:hypothetical protein
MNIKFINKKYLIILGLTLVLLGLLAIYFIAYTSVKLVPVIKTPVGRIINENLVIPDLTKTEPILGRAVKPGAISTPLLPQTDEARLIFPQAKLSLKQGYDLANSQALLWSADAKLIYLKSAGAVALTGQSSQWLLVFGAKEKAAGLEIVIQADQVVLKKEITTDSFGYNLPQNWYDSAEAIAAIQSLPQFNNNSISAISFYYNLDSKQWNYAFAIDQDQTTSMIVK